MNRITLVLICILLPLGILSAAYVEEPLKEISARADAGDAYSQAVLGAIYREGERGEQDFDKALTWLERAANQGDPLGLYHLGQMYREGQALSENIEKAMELFRAAASGLIELGNQGNPRAQEALSLMYLYGLGVQKNETGAVVWLRKAGEQGFPKAMLNLGITYYHGLGVEVDYAESKRWYERLAKQGDDRAQYKLAGFHAFGLGVAQDIDKAIGLCRELETPNNGFASWGLPSDYIIPNLLPPKHALDIEEGSCGEACLWSILHAMGAKVTQLEINRAGGFPGRGLHAHELFGVLRAYGISFVSAAQSVDAGDSLVVAQRYRDFLRNDVIEQILLGKPVLIGIKVYPTENQAWYLDHFVLLVGYNESEDQLIFNDFSRRKRIRAEKLLERNMDGYSFVNDYNSVYAIVFDGFSEN